MKEEAFLRRRFSLCPPSSTPQKVNPRKLSRNLLFGGENELYPLSPGQCRHGLGRPLGPGSSRLCARSCDLRRVPSPLCAIPAKAGNSLAWLSPARVLGCAM